MLRISNLTNEKRQTVVAVANMCVNIFYKYLTRISQDKDALKRIISDSINPSQFYVAIQNDEVIGFVTISTADGIFPINFNITKLKNDLNAISQIRLRYLNKAYFKKAKITSNCDVYIEGIAVIESYRGQGIGTMLLEHIEKLGYKRIFGHCNIANKPMHNLFEKLGYTRYDHATFSKFYGSETIKVVKVID